MMYRAFDNCADIVTCKSAFDQARIFAYCILINYPDVYQSFLNGRSFYCKKHDHIIMRNFSLFC